MKYILIFFTIFTISLSNDNIEKYTDSTFNIGHFDSVNEIKKHPKNDLFISIGKDEQIILWNFNKNSINLNFSFNSGELNNLEISPNGNFILVSNKQGEVFLINYNTFKLIDAFNYLNSKIINFYFINNHEVIIVYQNKKIVVFDIFKKERVRELAFETEILESTIDKNRENLILAERTGKISYVRVSDFKVSNSLFFKTGRVTALNFVDSEKIIIGYDNQEINLVNLKSKRVEKRFSFNSFPTEIISTDKLTIIGLRNGEIKILSNYLDNFYLTLNKHKKSINSILFDNNRIISCSSDSNIIIWDLKKDNNDDSIILSESELDQIKIKKFSNR